MDTRSIIGTIFKRLDVFLIVFVPIVLAGIVYLLFATPSFESSTKLLIQFGQDARPDMAISQNGAGLSAEEKRGLVQSNVNILTSRDLAEVLLKEVSVEKAYPELVTTKNDSGIKLNAAIDKFSRNITTKTESDAGIIEVSINNKNAQTAQILLKILVDLFIKRQADVFGNPQVDALHEQANKAYKNLEDANKELFAYKAKVGISSVDEEITLLLTKRSDIAEYLSHYKGSQVAPDTNVTQSQEHSESATVHLTPAAMEATSILPAKMGEGMNESPFPALDETQKRIDDLQSKQNEMLQTYKPNSPVIKNLADNLAAENATLQKSVLSLKDKLTELDRRIQEMNLYKADFDILARKVQLSEETYKTARTRLQAAEVNTDLNQKKITQVSVVQEPTLPLTHAKPKKFLTLILCIIIGTAFGGAAVIISELTDNSFKSREELEGHFKDPVLVSFAYSEFGADGVAHKVNYWRKRYEAIQNFVAKYTDKVKSLPVYTSNKNILLHDNLAKLYQSISSLDKARDKNVLMLTSSYKGEGSTTIVLGLSEFLVGSLGKSVLLIDDETSFHERLPKSSLLDVIEGNSSLDEAINSYKSMGYPVSFAYFSKKDKQNSVVAHIDDLTKMIKELRGKYDYILIAASGIFADSNLLAYSQLADAIILVIEADRTRSPVVEQAVIQIKATGTDILGLILNKQTFYIPDFIYKRF